HGRPRPLGQLPRRRRAWTRQRDRRAGVADRRLQHLLLVMAGNMLDRALVLAMPAVPKVLVQPLSRRYIAGPDLADALETIHMLDQAGRSATVDVLGEQLTTRTQIEDLVQEYQRALDAFARERVNATLSVKMTGLGL